MAEVEVRVGQVWADNDKRSEGRRLRVDEVSSTHATVTPVDVHGQPTPSVLRARRTRIRLDRFKPTATGYRLVEEADRG